MKRIIIALLVGTAFAGQASAESTPSAGRYDSRVRNAHYRDGQVYKISTNLVRATSIEFGSGEVIDSIVSGDTVGFKHHVIKGGQAVSVKPQAKGISTNFTIYTNRRAYYFEFQETSNAPYYAVRFDGGIGVKKSKVVPPSKMVKRTAPYTSYGANTLNDVTPLSVWDDGAFTYFRFPDAGRMPAIFKTTTGIERTVNSTTMADGTVRVSGVSLYWVLRAGKSEVVINMMDPAR